MEAKLSILGCGSAAPTLHRANTAQILHIANKKILIDCGEGTQLQMLKLKINAFKIDLIFISHLHGDHYLGLPGLLNTLSLYNRTKPLTIFGPKGIKKLLLNHFKETRTTPHFEINIIELKAIKKTKIYHEGELKVYTFPLQHRIPCYGFHFIQSQFTLHINKIKCDKLGLGIDAIICFKNANNFEKNGTTYHYKQFTNANKKKISYTFVTDTLFLPQIAANFKNTNLLYHESTYLNNLLDKATTNYHSTALQAAQMAVFCGAKQLILGHYSSRYITTNDLLLEAKTIVENCDLAEDGKIFIIK